MDHTLSELEVKFHALDRDFCVVKRVIEASSDSSLPLKSHKLEHLVNTFDGIFGFVDCFDHGEVGGLL